MHHLGAESLHEGAIAPVAEDEAGAEDEEGEDDRIPIADDKTIRQIRTTTEDHQMVTIVEAKATHRSSQK